MPANITVFVGGKVVGEYVNTSRAVLKFNEPGEYTLLMETVLPEQLAVGLKVVTIKVKHGELGFVLVDRSGVRADYADVNILLNRGGKRTWVVSGKGVVRASGLSAGNYTVMVVYKGLVLAVAGATLNITTDGSNLTIVLPLEKLGRDYRGVERVVAVEHPFKLVWVKDLGKRYPYASTSVAVEGHGSFRLCLDYGDARPPKVRVASNATVTGYVWSGSCLVVEGFVNSTAVVNVTDLYSLTVELRDKLGNLLPSQLQPYAIVNGSKVEGSKVELYLEPGVYTVSVPYKVGGFEFAGYSDGKNTTEVNVTLTQNHKLTAYYRVPVSFESVQAYRLAVAWWQHLFKLVLHQHGNETVEVSIEGFLKDYYGRGVAGKTVEVRFEDPETGAYVIRYAKTDATGYFETKPAPLLRGKTYKVYIAFHGDDTYTPTQTTLEVTTAEQLPETQPPTPPLHILIATAIAAAAILAAIRAIRAGLHTTQKYINKS